MIPNSHLAKDFDVRSDAFVFLRYEPGADPKQTRAAIDRTLAASFPDAQTRDREHVKKQQEGQINQLLYLIYALLGLSLIVAFFGIVNRLALSIFERTRELGLLRAVGMSRRQVKRIVRLEAVITSLIGALLGLVLGILFALAISRPLEAEGFKLTFPVRTLLAVLVCAALAGVLASLWPARPRGAAGRAAGSGVRVVTICRCLRNRQLDCLRRRVAAPPSRGAPPSPRCSAWAPC